MNTIVYQNKDLEYHFIQLGNYPTSNFFEKCERCGLKIFCVIEGGIIKDRCLDFLEHQSTIAQLLHQRSILMGI